MESSGFIRPVLLVLALTLTFCDGDGGDGDADVDGGGDADADGDGGLDADVDGDADVAPSMITFALHFISDVPESIWLADGAPELTERHWITVRRGEQVVAIAPSCECPCDACPCDIDCEAPCHAVTELQHSATVEYQWDGMEYLMVDCPATDGSQCQRALAAPAGVHTARFCWGYTPEGSGNCSMEVQNVQCEEVEFELPDADGLVEYVVNYSG